MGLLDFLQSANNTAASTVSAPVDGIAWLLRKAGMPVPAAPVGSSAWLEQQGLTRPVQQSAASLAGETAGLLSPALIAAKAPQLARGLLQAAENMQAPREAGMAALQRGAVPASSMSAAEREAAMQAAGMERGWYRGGQPIVDGKKSGDWYTRFQDEAADYAKRIPSGDVREYAVPAKSVLRFNRDYPNRLAADLATDVEKMGPTGKRLAAEIRKSYGPGEAISGAEAWRGLSTWLGEDAAAQVLSNRGFRAVEGVNNPQYMRLLPGGVVRDANLAKFDPARINVDDIFGAADPTLLAALAAGSGGLLAAVRNRGGE